MVICKYFPNCRYGNNCRFEHVYPNSQFSRGGTQQYFAGTSYYHHGNKTHGLQKHASNTPDISEVMRVVIQEITQAEKGGQWPLSCFTPIKERQCFPGMVDYSPEEIRWKMYEAAQNGTLIDCQRKIKELYEAARQKRNCLKTPNSEIYTQIEKLYYGHKIDLSAGSTVFPADGAKPLGNKFAFNTQSFGNTQQSAETNMFNVNFKISLPQLSQQQGILGRSSLLETSQIADNRSGVFGGIGNSLATAPQGFGSVSQNVPALQTSPQNAFGEVRPITSLTSNVFGGMGASNNVFGVGGTAQAQLSTAFGGEVTPTLSINNGFLGDGIRTISSNNISGEGIATSVPSNIVFGRNDMTMPFGRNDAVSTSSTFGAIGNMASVSDSVIGRSTILDSSASFNKSQYNVLDSSLYTLKEELNQDELQAFSAHTFTLGLVPTRPPPKELCC